MGKFDKILIVSDIDGTLLSDDGKVCERNVRAVDYFVENGGAFTIASGRNSSSIKSVLSQIRVNVPCLLLNGSMIYDYKESKVLWEQTVEDKEVSRLLSDIMLCFSDVGVEIFTAQGMCVIRQNSYTELHKYRDPKNFFSSTLENAPRPWYKAILTDEPQKLRKVSEVILKSGIMESYPTLRFVFSENIFFELMSADVSKGNALFKLRSMDGYGYTRIFAVGDNYNDLELLKAADVAVAPENAVEEVKSEADFIMCRNNSGVIGDVVEMIERYIQK